MVPKVRGGPEEQEKAELRQYAQSAFKELARLILIKARVLLDAYARRHEAQKVYLRQLVAQHWVAWRELILQGQRPNSGNREQLAACDMQLRAVSDMSVFGVRLLGF